ncbi:MAG: hypothetical protein HPY52_12575 [Firmicutes bacterium]|nr:hypothetical protein [Bacillota bacterium]
MERIELRIPHALNMLPNKEKGIFSRAIASSAKLRMATLEKRLKDAQTMLQRFENKYGKSYRDFESSFPDDADMEIHEDLVEWAFWDRVAEDCSAAINGYRLLTGR